MSRFNSLCSRQVTCSESVFLRRTCVRSLCVGVCVGVVAGEGRGRAVGDVVQWWLARSSRIRPQLAGRRPKAKSSLTTSRNGRANGLRHIQMCRPPLACPPRLPHHTHQACSSLWGTAPPCQVQHHSFSDAQRVGRSAWLRVNFQATTSQGGGKQTGVRRCAWISVQYRADAPATFKSCCVVWSGAP